MKSLMFVIIGIKALSSAARVQTEEGSRRVESLNPIVVRGVVFDERTDRPLPGAQVVADRSIGTNSNWEGRYLITGLPNKNQTIRVSLPGYVPETREFWVCTPILYPGGTCTPGAPSTHDLHFYLRTTPPTVR